MNSFYNSSFGKLIMFLAIAVTFLALGLLIYTLFFEFTSEKLRVSLTLFFTPFTYLVGYYNKSDEK